MHLKYLIHLRTFKNLHFYFKVYILSVLLALCLCVPYGLCLEICDLELNQNKPRVFVKERKPETNVGGRLVSFFQNHISKVDGDRCPSLPSCSSYSVQVFKKHGFFMGWLMTVDRLIHEADEGSLSPLVFYNGQIRIHDPVENNDFWWFHQNGSDKD